MTPTMKGGQRLETNYFIDLGDQSMGISCMHSFYFLQNPDMIDNKFLRLNLFTFEDLGFLERIVRRTK